MKSLWSYFATLIACAIITVAFVNRAIAQDVSGAPSPVKITSWQHDPSISGDWFRSANWTSGVPTEAMMAEIANGGKSLIGTRTSGAVARQLWLGGERSGTLDQLGGTLKVDQGIWLGSRGHFASYGFGQYNLSDGQLVTPSIFIDSGLTVSPHADLSVARGSAIKQLGGRAEVGYGLHVGYWPFPVILNGTEMPVQNTSANIDLTYPYRPGATYQLVGGDLETGETYIGHGGKGKMIQSAGRHVVANGLHIGGANLFARPLDSSASSPDELWKYPWYEGEGRYVLTDGELSARLVHVGRRGRGSFSQRGGSVRVASTLQVGSDWWWWRSEPVPANVLNVDSKLKSDLSSILPPSPHLSANGTYTLSEGRLTTGGTEVGIGGHGRFIQTGGAHKVDGALRIGGQAFSPIMARDTTWITEPAMPTISSSIPLPYPSPSRARYILADGLVIADRLEIGAGSWPLPYETTNKPTVRAPWKGSKYYQMGGRTVIEDSVAIHGGRYDMAGGMLIAGEMILSGRYLYDRSQYVQSGGDVTIQDGLYIGTSYYKDRLVSSTDTFEDILPHRGRETFHLRNGTVQAQHIQISGVGESQLLQKGGSINVSGSLQVVGPGATYDLRRGNLNAGVIQIGGIVDTTAPNGHSGRWHLSGPDTHVSVNDTFILGNHAQFDAHHRSRIFMNGADHENYSTDAKNVNGLDRLRMIFSIGPEDDLAWETYEVAGEDFGMVRKGFVNNFSLGILQLGGEDIGEVQLIDNFDNQPDSKEHEALYVRHLLIGPGSRLDLNGLNLYTLHGRIDPTAEIIGGELYSLEKADWARIGDTNLDGDVDGDDFLTWQGSFPMDTDAVLEIGDNDWDQDVDGNDFLIWQNHFGFREASLAAVPEPASLLLLVCGSCLLGYHRRRKPDQRAQTRQQVFHGMVC